MLAHSTWLDDNKSESYLYGMLELRNISRKYRTGDLVQTALDGVSVNLRDCEFVSVLGPSGSGKTTLLNIIGGLDRADSGTLVINGRSTAAYTDRDWDAYRCHRIGFVFQSYNLIGHQSILSNVELALTIAGLSGSERKKRAMKALEDVGLKGQEHKKPSQLSGGQAQRVAIARALVNNPDILLADEPTGALDSETSLQVMELLRQVAADRLVVMVTHNAELAGRYSTRIIRLRDGRIVEDSAPFTPKRTDNGNAREARTGMSFLTSLSLSARNLLTKKGRTVLTALAGSIGIIGIALILSLSTGVNNYIADVQKQTMSSYPVTISTQALDLSGVMDVRQARLALLQEQQDSRTDGLVRADYTSLKESETLSSSVVQNDLTAFKHYLDDPDSPIRQYVGTNGIIYDYDVSFSVYARDPDGLFKDTDSDSAQKGGMQLFSSMMGTSSSARRGASNFSAMMQGSGNEAISRVVTDSYDLLAGSWPTQYDELVLVLDKSDSIPAKVLLQLGIISSSQFEAAQDAIRIGSEPDDLTWTYDDLLGREFYLVPACDTYVRGEDGLWGLTEDPDILMGNSVRLKITGIIRPETDAANADINTALAYTAALTDWIIAHTETSEAVLAQEAAPETNIFTGLRFSPADDSQKAADARAYLSGLGVSEKASVFASVMSSAAGGFSAAGASGAGASGGFGSTGGFGTSGNASRSDAESMYASMLDRWLDSDPDQATLVSVYDSLISASSYDENMKLLGKVSYDSPVSISIYADSFEAKEGISECIKEYNLNSDGKTQITYTDYVALLTSSLTSIVNVISYVLIAFVAVSLVVSSIMIGIITHISVLERTKEIGILRSLGASKANITQVFTAETVIIGLCSGILGIAVSALLNLPINAVLHVLTKGSTVNAVLPLRGALILICVSVAITVIGGLVPAKKASRKDPVEALRSE